MALKGPSFSRSRFKYKGGIKSINLKLNIETEEMILGCIIISFGHDKGYCVVGKVFIYKNASPTFIEVNLDESYISCLFEDPSQAARNIGEYTIDMLSASFPGSILNMETSKDVGMIQLPENSARV